MKQRTKKREQKLRRLIHMHLVITGFSLSMYFLIAFFDPGFLSYDLRQKYHTIASEVLTVSATVLGAPVSPIVTGTSQCESSTSTLHNDIDWPDDVNTYTYDIMRDGLPLASGLSLSEYHDNGIVVGTAYTYIVTAHGPMGSGYATSNTLSLITPPVCGEFSVTPDVQIYSFDGQSLSSYVDVPTATHRRPIFTGTTNIPNAIVQIVVGPPSNVIVQLSANINGYFSWQPPINFSYGEQVFALTVSDPSDSSRVAHTSFIFAIENNDRKAGKDNGSPSQQITASGGKSTPSVPILPSGRDDHPFAFSVSVENDQGKIFQGESLEVSVSIQDIPTKYENTFLPLRFSIIDEQGNTVTSFTHEELLKTGTIVRRSMEVPLYAQPGSYSVQIEILSDEANVSRIQSFSVIDLPLLSLGGEAFITYAEIVHNIGWIVLTLLVFLLLWLFLFMREYGLYLHALRHITEQHLMNAGLMTRRKGVIQ